MTAEREHCGGADIVVTGLGVLCGAGQDIEGLWQNLQRGESPANWVFLRGAAGQKKFPACRIPTELRRFGEWRYARQMDRSVQLALLAAGQAYTQARLQSVPSERLGVIAGTARGPAQQTQEATERANSGRLRPRLAAHLSLASMSGALSLEFGAQGPCLTVSATCASSASAIALGADYLQLGRADAVLVGGAEAPWVPMIVESFQAAGILGTHADPRRACRPFDVTRDGMLLGEGSGFLVLERRETAEARGIPILARLSGWAVGAESYQRTGGRPDGEGLIRVMRQALNQAGGPPDRLDYINMHGTATPLNDRIETTALNRILGPALSGVPCSSTKPMTGHCLGASAAIEAVICVLSLRRQGIPPTINCGQPDPACPPDIVREGYRCRPVSRVLSNSQGFWGNNGCLIFEK